GAELYFLYDDLLLLELRLVSLLGLAVLELTVIHDAAHRRHCLRCDLDEIQLGLLCGLVGRRNADDAELLAVGPNDANLRRVDLAVYPRFLFLSDVAPPVSRPRYAARPSRAASALILEMKSARLIWPRSSPLRVRTAIF